MRLRTCAGRALRARKTLTPHFTDYFTDFEKKTSVLQSTIAPVLPPGLPVFLANIAKKNITP